MKKNLLLVLCLSIAAILPGCHDNKTETRTTTRMTRDGKTMKKETTTRRERKKMKKEDRDMNKTKDEGKKRTKRMYRKTEREVKNY